MHLQYTDIPNNILLRNRVKTMAVYESEMRKQTTNENILF